MAVSVSMRPRYSTTPSGIGHHDWPLIVSPWTETSIAEHRIIPHMLDDLDVSVVRIKGYDGLESGSLAKRRRIETPVRTGVVDPGNLPLRRSPAGNWRASHPRPCLDGGRQPHNDNNDRLPRGMT